MASPSDIVRAPSQEESLWKVKHVQEYLQVSRAWVYLHAESGDLPALRFAGNLRFEPEQVRQYARGKQAASAKVLPLRSVPGGGTT